jgi:tetratricopeptide (TPR) repeat protein
MPTDTEIGESNENRPAAENPSAKPSRVLAIVVACIILFLPIGYLMLRHKPAAVAAQSAVPAVPPGPNIAQLEEMARTQPSVENRLHLSWGYLAVNQPGRAIPLLVTMLADDKNNADAWNNLCVAHAMQMSYNLAVDDCNHALHLNPQFQLASNNLKWAKDGIDQARQAIVSEEQLAPASRNAAAYLAEGLNYLHIGDSDQAIKAWQRAIEIDPRNALAANNIGIAYMAKKDPAKAIAWFEKAISIDPSLQLARNNLAWARDEAGKAAR